jgi:hypothetical protein
MKIRTCALLTALFFCFVSFAFTQEKEEILNLAVPKESKKAGWNLSAKDSKSNIKISWTDSAGQQYSTPMDFYEYPNGTFGAIAVITDMKNAMGCPASHVPLARIRKMLPLKRTMELVSDSPSPYKGYSLIDVQGRPTQFLEIVPVGKNKEQLSFSSGTLHFVFPKGSPDSGIEMLSEAPGTCLIVHPGVIVDDMKLNKGTLVIEIILKDIFVKDGTKPRAIRNALVRKVSTKGNEMVEIVTLPKGQ